MHRCLSSRSSPAQLVAVVEPTGFEVSGRTVEVEIDGVAVAAQDGMSLLEICDSAGRYIPRLCFYPGLACRGQVDAGAVECGLCVVRLGDGVLTLACATPATSGARVTTDDPELHALRLERLTRILARHPHICLACPDRDGCSRDQCTYGNPPESRCCDQFGRCELEKLIAHIDRDRVLRRRAVLVSRTASVEGRIRREPGLCIGCGRCVAACASSSDAARALELVSDFDAGNASRAVEEDAKPGPGLVVARPRRETLRASDCTFCGLCVIVCPTGAVTAPDQAGTRWLAERRKKLSVASPMLPPESRRATSVGNLAAVPGQAGVFTLFDRGGGVLRIGGVADLQKGIMAALEMPVCVEAAYFDTEFDLMFTQRESELLARYTAEHGHLPPGNDLGDDLYDDDRF